ncbi:hypothetical protein [Methylobacterium pseudosasicola]|uniref:Uncharacterized protein n=1 Tax=Methylobacterium pseudosasicola TaxID=582667 RepID=A0A1I4GL92_9HYPH|nr:hypothetical protein [Methylobacterium pseudosasicola]SFL30117.1 hypothetical protein SAMN05192568_100345 [Methylobacterium pseudosasicola]
MRIFTLLALFIGTSGAALAQDADLDWRTPSFICLIDAPNPDAGTSPPAAGPHLKGRQGFPRCLADATIWVGPLFRFPGGQRF